MKLRFHVSLRLNLERISSSEILRRTKFTFRSSFFLLSSSSSCPSTFLLFFDNRTPNFSSFLYSRSTAELFIFPNETYISFSLSPLLFSPPPLYFQPPLSSRPLNGEFSFLSTCCRNVLTIGERSIRTYYRIVGNLFHNYP